MSDLVLGIVCVLTALFLCGIAIGLPEAIGRNDEQER